VPWYCYCGRKITKKPVHRCECGTVWLWKRRSGRYVYAGEWKNKVSVP